MAAFTCGEVALLLCAYFTHATEKPVEDSFIAFMKAWKIATPQMINGGEGRPVGPFRRKTQQRPSIKLELPANYLLYAEDIEHSEHSGGSMIRQALCALRHYMVTGTKSQKPPSTFD